MSSRVSAFVIWALVAATGVFWGLRQFVRGPGAPAYTVPIGDSTVVRGDLTRLLGAPPVAPVAAAPAAPEISTRFRLVGVVAPRGNVAGSGVAVIAIDGKPARAFRVGATLDSGLMLRSVAQRSAAISNAKGDTSFTLELPTPVAAAMGSLPAVSMTSPDALASGARPQQFNPGAAPMMAAPQMAAPPAPIPGFPPPPTDTEGTPLDLPPPPLDQNGQPMR